MAKVLYITANPKSEEQSFSKSVARELLNSYKQKNADAQITELELFEANVPQIDGDVLGAWGALAGGTSFDQLSAAQQQKVGRLGELVEQFMAHDLIVFAVPMWNFSYPPVVKAYIDSFCVAGKTFRYTESGPVGLLGDKRAVIVQGSGGVYSEGPAAEIDLGMKHLRAVLGFVGITNVETLYVEGMAAAPDKADEIKQNAVARAKDLGASL